MRNTILITMLLTASALYAAKPKVVPAPVPTELATAKTVFLANACDADYLYCANVYNRLYAGIQSAGKYQLVAQPADADLIFEFHYATHLAGHIEDDSRLNLAIIDRATHVTIWSISEPVSDSSIAVPDILLDLQVISQPGAVAGPIKRLPTYKKPNDH